MTTYRDQQLPLTAAIPIPLEDHVKAMGAHAEQILGRPVTDGELDTHTNTTRTQTIRDVAFVMARSCEWSRNSCMKPSVVAYLSLVGGELMATLIAPDAIRWGGVRQRAPEPTGRVPTGRGR